MSTEQSGLVGRKTNLGPLDSESSESNGPKFLFHLYYLVVLHGLHA